MKAITLWKYVNLIANDGLIVPVGTYFDLSTFLNKYKGETISAESYKYIFDFTPPYIDLDKWNFKTIKSTNDQNILYIVVIDQLRAKI